MAKEGVRGTVYIKTLEGADYTFPDVDLSELLRVLPSTGRIPANAPTLTLVNASSAVMSIPFRIIQSISAQPNCAQSVEALEEAVRVDFRDMWEHPA